MARMNLAGLTLALMLASGAAEAKQWRYAGLHPRTGQPNGGLCHIQVVHVHAAPPVHGDVMYRLQDGVYIFIGDPTPFGYEGPKHAFYGHHPVTVDVVLGEEAEEVENPPVEYCYHDGPHYHAYEPPPQKEWVEKEDVYYYAGDYPAEYKKESPKRVRVNTVYRTWRHERPVVKEAPPPEYHGPVVQVNLAVPLPTLEVHVGAVPARHDVVIVEEHVHMKHKHKHKHKGKHKGWGKH